jgi:hypothetical protein
MVFASMPVVSVSRFAARPVGAHSLSDGTHSCQSRSDRRAHDGSFGERRINDTVNPKLFL